MTMNKITSIASIFFDMFCMFGAGVLVVHWFGHGWLSESQYLTLYNVITGYCLGQVTMGWRNTELIINMKLDNNAMIIPNKSK